jgi:outer membrane protein assembly factor BamB
MDIRKTSHLRWQTVTPTFLGRMAILIVLAALVLISCGPQSPRRAPFHFAVPTPYPSRQVTSSDFGWQERWRQQMKSSVGHVPLAVVVKDRVILPTDTGTTGMLVALNLHTGQPVWTQEFISPYRGDGAQVDSILADDEQVYLATPYVIQAYSVEDGKPRWTSTELPGHTSYDLAPSGRPDVIRIYGDRGYYVDKKDGRITLVEQGGDVPEITTDTLICQFDQQYALTCMDRRTNQRLWRIEPGWPATGVSIDSKVLVLSVGANLNSLIGIDQTTGKELWRISDQAALSNFIVFDGKIYAITSDVALTAYDPITGRKVGQMKFSGGSFDINSGNRYWLLATDSEILVHLGDSQELIAFRPQ